MGLGRRGAENQKIEIDSGRKELKIHMPTPLICRVAVYDVETFKIHLNGKKHMRKQQEFYKIRVGKEYIRRSENPGGTYVLKCELCCEQILDVSIHLNSYSHILAVLKTNHPKVFENLQLRGLNNIKTEELKGIVVAEMFPEAFQQYGYLDSRWILENLFPDTKKCAAHVEKARSSTEIVAAVSSSTLQTVSRKDQESECDENREPPQNMARMNDPPYNDKSDTITEHVKEKNSDLVQNEENDHATDQRQIQTDCQEYQEYTVRSDLKNIEPESPFKIACNKDLYSFLQYFQISDETDVIFIQQIVRKFKSQLQEFNENDEQVTTISGLVDGKDQEESMNKLNICGRAKSILHHADSTTTSNASEITANKSAGDLKDHSKGECRTNHAGNHVDHFLQYNSSKVTTTQATASNSVSSPHSSIMLCPTMNKPIIRPSVSSSVLKSHHQSIASIKKEPGVEEPQLDCTTATNTTEPVPTATASNSVSSPHSSIMLCPTTNKPIIRPSVSSSVLKSHHQSIASIKKEPGVEEPQLDCTTATNTTEPVPTATASNSVSSPHSSIMLCPTTNKPIIRPSVSSSVLKSHHQSIASIKKEPGVEEPQLDCTTATNTTEPVPTGTTGSHLPVFYSSGTLSTGKPKCIIRPSVLSSVLKKSLPIESHVSDKRKRDTLASDKLQASPEGRIGPTKVQSHFSKSEFGKDQPPSMCLESSSSDKNKGAPAAKKPRIDHLNFPTSPSHTHDSDCISFGGKKDMQISELIAEVAKFADTKPVLKGIDINQVVQILIRNRTEKNRNESQDSTE
ncbi:uncharacterized protein [Phyllobates terribilis]|uniref:uncharacterized protein isoform X3 n=1 Tax=Phyllobates terribilis TaxID=111132 RepID=UPI003CCB0E3C